MTVDELEEHEAVLRMWMRRVSAHPMLEVAILRFQFDLGRLDKELRKTSTGPTFDQDIDQLIEERVAAIRNGRSDA
jgi:hypothetical protein